MVLRFSRSKFTSTFWYPVSTSRGHCYGSFVASEVCGVVLIDLLSICALSSLSTSSVSICYPHGFVEEISIIALHSLLLAVLWTSIWLPPWLFPPSTPLWTDLSNLVLSRHSRFPYPPPEPPPSLLSWIISTRTNIFRKSAYCNCI